MNFLKAVQQILINSTYIRGDDEAPDDFDSLQYPAAIRISRNAVKYQITRLIANHLIPYEFRVGEIVTRDGTGNPEAARTYDLPSDFVRFFGKSPFLQNDFNLQIFEFDDDDLRLSNNRSNVDIGQPYAWYIERDVEKKIGLVAIPNEIKRWTFQYEAEVQVSNENDTLPFQSEQEAEQFVDLCTEHFKIIDAGGRLSDIETDIGIKSARSILVDLMRYTNKPRRYGNAYRSVAV